MNVTCPRCHFLLEVLVVTPGEIRRATGVQTVFNTEVAHVFSSENLKPSPKPKHQYTEVFLEFWSIYPLHKNKLRASKAYVQALCNASATEINEGARKYALWCQQNEVPTDKIKHADGWLSGARWEDEYGELTPSAVMQREDDLEARRRLAGG